MKQQTYHVEYHGVMKRKRMTLATALGAVFAMLLTVFGTPSLAVAAFDPEATTTLEIHKFEQPDGLPPAPNGLPQDTTGLTPVEGVTFTAKVVPGIDLTTNAGQSAATDLSLAEAAERVKGENVADEGVTDASGQTTLSPLKVGLYYVEETDTPAGYAGAVPFLVMLPLTHPVERDHWLTTVHVYPKNAKAGITLDVIDEDAVKLGDSVRWFSRSDIPRQDSIDGYRVDQVINANLKLVGTESLEDEIVVTLDCADCPDLVPGVDYTLSYDENTRTLITTFLTPGLEKLQAAVGSSPTVKVQIDYTTTVHAEGIHVNEAILYPSQAAIEKLGGVHDTATTKWGPISVLVHEHGNPENLIPGARFELFLTLEDAHARQNPIVINGVGEWTTDEQGRLIIHGLRFSNYVNDLDRESSDPLYRLFWAVPNHVPAGWTWVDETPLAGAVTDAVEYQTLIFEVEKFATTPPPTDPTPPPVDGETPPPAEPGGELPMTGAQMMGLGVLAVVLIAVGLVLLKRRRGAAEPTDVVNT